MTRGILVFVALLLWGGPSGCSSRARDYSFISTVRIELRNIRLVGAPVVLAAAGHGTSDRTLLDLAGFSFGAAPFGGVTYNKPCEGGGGAVSLEGFDVDSSGVADQVMAQKCTVTDKTGTFDVIFFAWPGESGSREEGICHLGWMEEEFHRTQLLSGRCDGEGPLLLCVSDFATPDAVGCLACARDLHFCPPCDIQDMGNCLAQAEKSQGCSTASECPAGKVCLEGRCEVQSCTRDSDCGSGNICRTGTCRMAGPDDDVDDAGMKDVKDAQAQDLTEIRDGIAMEDRIDCKSCTYNSDCGSNFDCALLGSTKHCLAPCITDGDCPGSYVCYTASTSGKSCVPQSFTCVPCAFDQPCDSGKTCDLVSGNCKVAAGLCNGCTYDFDCGNGFRCWKQNGAATGACVPECTAGQDCTDSADFVCTQSDRGVRLCQPRSPAACPG